MSDNISNTSQYNIVKSIIASEYISKFKEEYDKIIDINEKLSTHALYIKDLFLDNTSSLIEDTTSVLQSFNENIHEYSPVLDPQLGEENLFIDSLIDISNNTNFLNIDTNILRTLGFKSDNIDMSGLIELPKSFIEFNISNILNGVYLNICNEYSYKEFKMACFIHAYNLNTINLKIESTVDNIKALSEELLNNYEEYIDIEEYTEKIESIEDILNLLYIHPNDNTFNYQYMIEILEQEYEYDTDEILIDNVSQIMFSIDMLMENILGQIINRSKSFNLFNYFSKLNDLKIILNI
jgi:hypothetical protein